MTQKKQEEVSKGQKKEGNVQLWQFILDLLNDQTKTDTVRWTSGNGDFQILDPDNLAKLWGLKKGRNNMTYDKLCRALRYYYAKDILIKIPGQRYSYRFLWKPSYSTPSQWSAPQNYPNYATGLRLPTQYNERVYADYGKLDSLRQSRYPDYKMNLYRSEASSMDALMSYRPHDLRSYPDTRVDTRQTWPSAELPGYSAFESSRNAFYQCQYVQKRQAETMPWRGFEFGSEWWQQSQTNLGRAAGFQSGGQV